MKYLSIFISMFLSVFAHAEDLITGFDDEVVEVRTDNGIEYWEIEKLKELPIPIIEKDDKLYAKVETADGGRVWVSLSYVKTSRLDKLKKNACTQNTIAKVDNPKALIGRGVGEECQ